MEVHAVDRSGMESPTTEYRFRVLPPPYLSWWAWIGYGGLLVGALYASGRWRARRAEARALALERVVEERTRQLAAARDQAEEASRSKSRFLANMSHELRTPLNGILGFTQILARDPELGGRNRDRLRVIQTSGDHLLGLINDVLDLARVEAGRVALRPAPFDLGGCWETSRWCSERVQRSGDCGSRWRDRPCRPDRWWGMLNGCGRSWRTCSGTP